MSYKALNPNAEPYYLSQFRTYVCRRPYFPFAIQNYQPRFCYLQKQQPILPNPQTAVGNSVKGQRRVAPARARNPLMKLAGENQAAVGSGVTKWVPKENQKDHKEKKRQTSSHQQAKVKRRNLNGGSGEIIPFPTCPFEQDCSTTTTLMIKNIPNQFRRGDLLRFLGEHCLEENQKPDAKSQFDFLYLPMDFKQFWVNNRIANLGYAFVNFSSPVGALKFYKSFHNRGWAVDFSNKICEITCAKLQGVDALRQNFANKIFWCHSEEYLPVILAPPCDGVSPFKLVPVGRRVGVPSRNLISKSY